MNTKGKHASMLKQILVPLDGSSMAEQALPMATRIARSQQGSILLVRVVGLLDEVKIYVSGNSSIITHAFNQEMDSVRRYLAHVSSLTLFTGIRVNTLALSGSVAFTILDAAKQENCDTIVLCSHGTTGLKRWMMGSIAQKIIRYSPIPTLVVNGRIQPDRLYEKHPIHILVTLDGLTRSEGALLPAAQLCSALSQPQTGTLRLLHVVKPMALSDNFSDTLGQKLTVLAEQEAMAYLKKIEQRFLTGDLAQFQLTVTSSVLSNTHVAQTITKSAEQELTMDGDKQDSSDIISLTTHGRSGLPRWFVGSTTEHILGTTTRPLLVVRPPE
jgi:nucleotide-binding universal stress UspA family protein